MGRALVNKTGGTLKKMIQSAPRMRGVTPVPNGPLVKKNGSTLKKGGTVKKAQNGDSTSVSKSRFMNGLVDIAKSNSEKAKRPRFNNPLDHGKSLSEQNGAKDLEQFRKTVTSKQRNGGKLKSKYKK